MATFPFMQVDAFTDRPLGGNPCAIIFDSDELDDKTMAAIAQEMNLSETAFVRRSSNADFGVRYFTPAEEIPMAGHPTIATAFALVSSGRLALTGAHTRVTFELQVGPIQVELKAIQGKIQHITMTQKKPEFLATHSPEKVMPMFGLAPADLIQGAPIRTVSTGTPQLMIPLANHLALRRAVVDQASYTAYRGESDFFSPHLFCLGGATGEGDTYARHFGVPPDTTEDPFTGSATGGMAAYLWHYDLIDRAEFIAEQGHWIGRPGKALVRVIGPRENAETVNIRGQAALIMRGELIL